MGLRQEKRLLVCGSLSHPSYLAHAQSHMQSFTLGKSSPLCCGNFTFDNDYRPNKSGEGNACVCQNYDDYFHRLSPYPLEDTFSSCR